MTPTNRRQLLRSVFAVAIVPDLGFAKPATKTALDPRSFGARGDGLANDTAPLLRALASGRAVDGGGRTFAVSGWLRCGPAFAGLSNCTIRQLDRFDRNRTLYIEGARGFHLRNVAVVRGGQNDDALIQADMQDKAGVWLEDCADFILDGVAVTGGGIGTGLVISACRGFTASDCRVSHILYRLTRRPPDDMIQGIWINRSSDFTLARAKVWDLGGQDSQGASRDNNRGVAVSGSTRFKIVDLDVSLCGQGLDVTGTEGNHQFLVTGGHARDCWTWGFKFANSAQIGTIAGAIAERCGLGGFVVSSRTEAANPEPHDIQFVGCTALDCGRPGSPNTIFGFGVINTHFETDYPRRVRFIRCNAADRRAVPGMKWGFYNEIQTPAAERNTVDHCTVSGATIKPYRGFA